MVTFAGIACCEAIVMAKRTPTTKLPASSARGPKKARQRRLQAARLFQQGLSQAEVARRL
jgi:hypothetical protein